MSNKNLSKAKKAKNDEFYTLLPDIEKEMKHYKEHFKGKVVFCNCDDPVESNFWKYFHLNFDFLGLKRLVSTHYHQTEPTYKMVYEGGNDNDCSVGVKTPLTQNGDFRSPESIELLKESDIVVTNPPFSLFREYVAQLIEHGKKFLVLGNMNALTYKEIFPLIKDNNLWLGYENGGKNFKVPNDYNAKHFVIKGDKMVSMGNVIWYTNLDVKKRHEFIDLIEKYDPQKYPNYYNHKAIEVSKTLNIPIDYKGIMGVPISFLGQYNPEQFEIIDCKEPAIELSYYKKFSCFKTEYKSRQIKVNEVLCQKTYHRIFIKHKQHQ